MSSFIVEYWPNLVIIVISAIPSLNITAMAGKREGCRCVFNLVKETEVARLTDDFASQEIV